MKHPALFMLSCFTNKNLRPTTTKLPLLCMYVYRIACCFTLMQVARSKAVADARKEKGETANSMVDAIQNHALSVLGDRVKSNPSGYKQLIGQLISEGLVQLDEAVVTLEVLKSEVQLVSDLCASSLKQYKQIVKAQYDEDPVKYKTQFETSAKCTVNVNDKRPLDANYIGGVRLVGDSGRVICDNTLKTRMNIVVEEQLPQVRLNLFPSLTAKVLNDQETKSE